MIILIFIISYLIGCLPFGLIVSRFFTVPDPRYFGSGNIGATNMLRLGGRLPAFLTFLGDALKGVAAMFIGGGAMVAAFGVMLGHVFPFQLRFCGGKGVATYLGVLFYIAPLTATILMIFWVLFTLAFKKGALSSLILAALAPVLFFLVVGFKKHNLIIVCALSLFVLLTHIPNIIRLWRGTEKQADL